MAAWVQQDNVRLAHQLMHHLVVEAAWSDETMLAVVAETVLPKPMRDVTLVHWTIDDAYVCQNAAAGEKENINDAVVLVAPATHSNIASQISK